MLFILVMKALKKMMGRSVSGDFLKGFDASFRGHNNVTITYLLFANDTLVFGDQEVSQLDYLSYSRQILIWFQVVSGLEINFRKCEITTVRVGNNIEELVQVLNCKVGVLPITYLGTPLGASSKDLAVWNPVIEIV